MKQKNLEPNLAWADAHFALKYIKKGKARGSRVALWVRGESQKKLGWLGKWAGRRGGLVIFLGIILFSSLCIGIQNIHLDTTLDSLWTQDSGRLLQELTYVSRISGLTTDTNEMLIQTPKKDSHHSTLSSKALLEHLEVLSRALSVTVDLYDITWSVKDLCYSANKPTFDFQLIDQIFEKIFPCVIITPLDCFWEGSKLLGPDYPIQVPGFRSKLKWTNLNPLEMLSRAKLVSDVSVQHFPFEIVEGFMKRAGIGTGYQEKPCLNPSDPECPFSAPNKDEKFPPDVASILSQGCYGFAPRFMHWPPDLIIGETVQNKSGHIVKAGGLMSTVQLMSSSELFEFFKETWRLHDVDWAEEKAKKVLTTWQKRFSAEVTHLTRDEDRNLQFNFYSFTPATLDNVVEGASQFSWAWCGARLTGVIVLTALIGVLFNGGVTNWKLRFGLLIAGCLLISLGTAASSGVAGFLQIPFNIASVQVLPYLNISLVSQVLFILLHSQLNNENDTKTTMKKHGFSLLLGVLVAAVFIGSGAVFPIPAVRSLSLQGALFLIIGSLATLLIFPSLCQIFLRRRKHLDSNPKPNLVKLPPPAYVNKENTQNAAHWVPLIGKNNLLNKPNNLNSSNINDNNDNAKEIIDLEGGDTKSNTKTNTNLSQIYFKLQRWKWFTGIVIVIYFGWISFSVLGIIRLRLGLPITDVVPSHSSEWQFLSAQRKLFPIYQMRAVTKSNFDYPNNQKLLHKFHDSMSALPWVIRNENGGAPSMWLQVFKSWLMRLQKVFEEEWHLGYLDGESWNNNASADGILAWKLTVQTGHVDHPVDLSQLRGNKLVSPEGIINPKAFYVYLTAWAWNDPLAYGSTAANLKPEPRNWVHSPEDKDLKIPRSAPIKYAEISYLLRTTHDEDQEKDQESQILNFVREIRSICESFEQRGLPVFPWGIPFRFYEQYLNLPMNSCMALGLATGMSAIILFISLGFSVKPLSVILTASAITMLQIAGAVGWLGVGLNAFPVEIALLGVSLIVFSTVQIVVAFCCIPGTIVNRRTEAFSLVGAPCVQALLLTSLSALILYSPHFTFIFTHFTLLISISAIFALINLLLLVPILLSIFRPNSWVVGQYSDDPTLFLPLTPSPPSRRGNSSSGKGQRNSSSKNGGRSSSSRGYPPPPYNLRSGGNRGNHYKGHGANSRAPSENSLSTITEEPTSCATRKSAEIIVQPQVVVETFDGESNSTKTKVSAKLKVEVHSSISNGIHSINTFTNTSSENSGTNSSTNSSQSVTSSSGSSACSYNSNNERGGNDD